MIEYRLLKFSGDSELEGKATAILSWNGGDGADAMSNITSLKCVGITHGYIKFDSHYNRWTVTLKTITKDIIITVDANQRKIVVLSDNRNINPMFRIVESILNSPYETDFMCRVQKVLMCIKLTIKKRFK